MTLDEAIKHAEEVAEEKENEGKLLCQSEGASVGCLTCASEHRQLAEWLKDYKRLLEQQPCDDAVIRQAVLEMAYDMSEIDGEHFTEPHMVVDVEDIQKLPPATQKSGKWIRVTDKAGHLVWECDKCGWQQRLSNNFCPDCGCRMVEPQESEDKK